MTLPKPNALVKPTLDTKFHIDYEWWTRHPSEDLRTYLLSHLQPDQRERLSKVDEQVKVDYIHPKTAEVFQLDELRLALQEAAEEPNFINPHTSLVDSIFRVFLSNGNTALSPRELEEITGRDANTILKTLGGRTVYKGIRPSL